MKVVLDRFPELMEAIRETLDSERSKRLARDGVREQQRVAKYWLIKFSPYSTPATFVTTGHDHTSIRSGWRDGQVTDFGNAGAEAVIVNVSEHVDVQRTGIETEGEYTIPHNPTGVVFWLGPPLHTPIRSQQHRFKVRQGGFFRFYQITRGWGHGHFGPWRGRDFAEVAAESMSDSLARISDETTEKIAFERLRRFFG